MHARSWSLTVPLAVVLLSLGGLVSCSSPMGGSEDVLSSALPQERGGQETFGPYELVENWPRGLPDGPDGVTHAGWTWGSMGSVYAESPDRIWIAMRGELPLPEGAEPWTPYALLNPSRGNAPATDDNGNRGYERRYHHVIFVVDGDGNLVQDWPQHDELFATRGGRGPHKIKMSPYDPDKHVWVVDDNQHQIFKFTYDGELVMTLGESLVPGRDGNHFSRPTDIAWLPDGTFFISDGYVGKRVAKFDPDGNFLMDWGVAPADPSNPGPNEFNTVHSIAVSADRRVFVVDRSHGRVQVFDENGEFLDMFYTGPRGEGDPTGGAGVVSRPYAHLITADQHLWISDGGTHRILKYDLDGNYLYGWGGPGTQPGQFQGPHALTVDQEGNLYTAEVFNGRVQKFRPRPNADPAKLVGQELRYPVATTSE